MKATALRLTILATSLLAASHAMAADMDMPGPELRPSSYELGVGVFGETRAADSWYNNGCDCERDISGIGYGAGLKASFDYVSDGWFAGVVGDWSFGGTLASNADPDQPAYFKMPSLGTLRARAGLTSGDAAIYLSGGVATALTELGANIEVPVEGGEEDETEVVHASDSQWTVGWTVGTGVSYDVTDNVSVDLEYLYIHLNGSEYDFGPGPDNGGNAFQSFDATHTVRMGVNYLFSM